MRNNEAIGEILATTLVNSVKLARWIFVTIALVHFTIKFW